MYFLHVSERIAMRCLSGLVLVATLGILLTWATFAPAQVRPADPAQLGNTTDQAKFKGAKAGEFDNYLRGVKQPSKETKELLELGSHVFIFQFTWFPALAQKRPDLLENGRNLFKNKISLAIQNADKNQETVKMWSPILVSTFKQVLDLPIDDNRLACLNVALLLPDLARLPARRPEIADFLVTLLEDDKKSDLIKRWAAEALTEFFPATEFDVVLGKGDAAKEKQKQTDLKRVNALVKFVTRKWTPPKDASKGEIEGFRFVRRKVIEALGKARVPVIEADQKTKKIQGDVIQALLPFLDPEAYTKEYGDANTPEPSLAEKIEAAIAISRMKVHPNSAYQPDQGIYRVGTVLAEVADAYKKDYNRFAGRGNDKIAPMLTWRVYAARIRAALAEMVESVRGDALRTTAADNARRLQEKSQQLLDAMQADRARVSFNPQDLADAAKAMRPSSGVIFKGISTPSASGGG
jgi:hypothetical protein